MSGVGEAVVQHPDGQVGVPVASATSSQPSAGSDSRSSAIFTSAQVVAAAPGVDGAPTAPVVDAQASASPESLAGQYTTPAGSLTAVIPSPTQVIAAAGAAAGNTAISIVSVPANNAVPAPLPPEAEAPEAPTSTPPVEPTSAAPAVTHAAGVASTGPIPSPEPSSIPPTETSVDAVAPAPTLDMAEPTSIPVELPSETVNSDSIPSAIGSANIFAPAELPASDTGVDFQPSATTTPPAMPPPGAEITSVVPSGASGSASDTQAGVSSAISASTLDEARVYGTPRSSGINDMSTTATSFVNSVTSQSHTRSSASSRESGAVKSILHDATKSGITTSSSTPTSKNKDESVPDTTFVSGSVTLTGAAAISAADFAHNGEGKSQARNGMSSFAIIGIVGGILVFFILLYIGWFQWRRRRSRDDSDRLDDGDTYDTNATAFDPYGLGEEKYSGFDFIDQPLSSRRSHKRRSGATTMYTENPFADPNVQYQRRLETEYIETWYSDPGEAGLGTARSKSMKWYDDDKRPSYIDGPKSIYHEANDPSDSAYPWPEDQSASESTGGERERDRPRSVPASARTNFDTPPVPPVPIAYRKSETESLQPKTRPQTNFTYGDYLTGYDTADSRPLTQYTQYTHDNPPQTGSTAMESPNTAAMLPWLNADRETSPSPPMRQPTNPRSIPAHHGQKPGFGSPPRMPLRGPVAAAMAQTPQMEDRGYQGVIPAFR